MRSGGTSASRVFSHWQSDWALLDLEGRLRAQCCRSSFPPALLILAHAGLADRFPGTPCLFTHLVCNCAFAEAYGPDGSGVASRVCGWRHWTNCEASLRGCTKLGTSDAWIYYRMPQSTKCVPAFWCRRENNFARPSASYFCCCNSTRAAAVENQNCRLWA